MLCKLQSNCVCVMSALARVRLSYLSTPKKCKHANLPRVIDAEVCHALAHFSTAEADLPEPETSSLEGRLPTFFRKFTKFMHLGEISRLRSVRCAQSTIAIEYLTGAAKPTKSRSILYPVHLAIYQNACSCQVLSDRDF